MITTTKIYVWLINPIDFWQGAIELEPDRQSTSLGYAWEIQELLNAVETAASRWRDSCWRDDSSYYGAGLAEGTLNPWVARKLDNNGNIIVAGYQPNLIGKQSYYNHCIISKTTTIEDLGEG